MSGDPNLDDIYEPHPIPDDYPRTRRTAIVAGWLVFIAFLVYAAYEWRVFL